MGEIIDLTNKKFGRLTVIKRVENDKHHNTQWLCKCDCGKEKIIVGSSLRKGITVSCGCYHKDQFRKSLTKHGLSRSNIHGIWNSMKQRCNNPNNNAYKSYGERGIKVFQGWEHNFMAFYQWAIKNGYKEGLTLDRIDNDKGYEPSNCRWVDMKTQGNNRRTCYYFTINGRTQTLSEWAREYGVPNERTRQRVINEGWDIVKALTTPSLNPDRRTTPITINNETKSIEEWCDIYNINYKLVYKRYFQWGWDIMKSLSTPSQKTTKKN